MAEQSPQDVAEIPEYIKGVSLDDLDELSANIAALNGIWEKSEYAATSYENQRQYAAQQTAHAHELTKVLSELDLLRREIGELLVEEKASQDRWRHAEAAMHTATHQFGLPAIQQSIERSLLDLSNQRREVENEFSNSVDLKSDLIGLSKKYVDVQQRYYLNKSLLDSVK